MKKRKFNLLLQIATLCLCVVAIAFGVYSAKSASLNVSGTVGFNAHNCLVEITGKYTACKTNNATTREETNLNNGQVIKVGGSAVDDYKKTLNITDTMYFSDLSTDGDKIVIELTITNKSAFKITVNAPAPTYTKADGKTAITTVTCATSNASFALDKEANKTITLSFTLSDVENAESIDPTSKFNINLSFEKWSQFTFLPIVETLVDSSGKDQKQPAVNKLCMTMGHSIVDKTGNGTTAGTDGKTETPLVWYAFAVKGEGDAYTRPSFVPTDNISITTGTGEKWYSLFNVDMSTVDYKNHTYWFIQQYVVAGGYKINDGSNAFYPDGILFNPDSGENYNNTYAQIDFTNDSNSKKSNIYTFLENDYATKTGVTAEEQKGIETRVVNEEYTVSFTDYNVVGDKLACQFSSKFWLINHAELGLLCNQPISVPGYTYKAYGISNQDGYTSFDGAVCGVNWWLRSPHPGDAGYALSVLDNGLFDSRDVYDISVGVRAAFQIQIK